MDAICFNEYSQIFYVHQEGNSKVENYCMPCESESEGRAIINLIYRGLMLDRTKRNYRLYEVRRLCSEVVEFLDWYKRGRLQAELF